MRIVSSTIVLALLAAVSAHGQAIVMKDGSRLGPGQFKVEGGKVLKVVKVGETEATSTLQMGGVAKLDWPTPIELTEGNALLAAGKTEEALTMLKRGQDLFLPFKEVPGNFYTELTFALVEALNQAGKFEDTLKAMPTLKALKMTPAQKLQLKILQLNIDRQTSSDYQAINDQAKNILAETDDSGIGSSICMIQGDVLFKQKKWEEALFAYLRVPVFYGTQVQRVPEAEINSARCLAKMRRFEDAATYYTRLMESYPGSNIAETAKTEKAQIAGLKNDADPEKTGDAATEPKKEGDAAAAAPTETKN
jgi:tetratricopeptide (TPR) repeat protein